MGSTLGNLAVAERNPRSRLWQRQNKTLFKDYQDHVKQVSER
jgi:hypothetical protein